MDEIALLEQEAAETASLRIEIAELEARHDEMAQYIADLEGQVAILKSRVANLESQIVETVCEGLADQLDIQTFPIGLRIEPEEIAAAAGDPRPWR